MSRESSPPSSLDFELSDFSDDENYQPYRSGLGKRNKPAARGNRVTKVTGGRGVRTAVDGIAAMHPVDGNVEEEEEGGKRKRLDLTTLELMKDHQVRPLWVDEEGHIILEAFATLAPRAQDFLIAIAEPVSRPALMHEYQITKPSLHAAMSVGLETQDIINVLTRLSKNTIPEQLIRDIQDSTSSYGKIRLVLKANKYYLESTSEELIAQLMQNPQIMACKAPTGGSAGAVGAVPGLERGILVKERPTFGNGTTTDAPQGVDSERAMDDDFGAVIGIERTDEIDETSTFSFEISPGGTETVKHILFKVMDMPALEEYDFRNDTANPNLDIQLKPMTVIRPYQETSLAKMFGNGRARSGIIVLPCGAGKTLVGITAACTIKKSTLVLCTSAVSVAQWKQQFLHFSNISDRQICTFTSHEKEMFSGPAGIVVCTYSMLSKQGKRAHDAEKMMNFLRSREWGFLLLDEVHVAPADVFRKCLSDFKVHAKLGLTATLVREDDKIDDLNYLIGPKLYEANWMDLAKNGHIATVQCAEVWCPMTPEFYREYLGIKSRKRQLFHAMNPNKIQACQFLIDYHERRGDKVIVFSDNVYSLEAYAKKLGKSFIHGGTPEGERLRILSRFQHDPQLNTIFLSKVGDTSIDLPEATCLVQISSHFGSRRQEAQRLGRILRAKRRNDEGFNAFFYSLVSKDTQEMFYSSKRQKFLIDQGYAFKVITELHGLDQMPNLVFPTVASQISLLEEVLNASDAAAETSDHYQRTHGGRHQHVPGGRQPNSTSSAGRVAEATRVNSTMPFMSGAQNMSYTEQNKSVNKEMAREERMSKKQKTVGKGSGLISKMRQQDAAKAKRAREGQ